MSMYNDYEKEIYDATYDFLDNYDYIQEWASDYKEIVAEENPDYTLEDYVFGILLQTIFMILKV